MSRLWRIGYEGALYHLLSRGNEGKDIFDDDRDRNTFLETVGEMSERFVMSVYAYLLQLSCYIHRNPLRAGIVQRLTDCRWIYLIWKTGVLTNNQIGQLFGLSYSAVSHAVKSLKARMSENQELTARFNSLYSQFKI